ncbi:MAG: two-component system, cell cycle response regulator [Solirubrobacteraceae bacterium]|nr:two-component system, cell cycle response regulator [Solirubrobacteraceae bacterium]
MHCTPSSRLARLWIVVGLFAAITAGRFASHNAADAVGVLFVVPIALLALDFGWRGGLVGGAVGTLITAIWANVQNAPITIVGYGTRMVAFLVVGVGIGILTAQRERSARDAERWFVMSNDLLCIANFDGYFTDVNDSWTTLLGYSREELLARPFESFVHPSDIQRTRECAAGLAVPSEIVNFENRYRAKDGTWHWLLWSARSDGALIYASVKDVTARKQRDADREELLRTVERLARTDSLTGVMNRATWENQLADELVRSARSGAPPSVLMVDLDSFKTLNDTEGHAAGDLMLRASASAWSDALRAVDRLGRLGGDEFAILLPECDLDDAVIVAERVRAATPARITCSMGLAHWNGSENADQLLHRADTSLYRAKDGGRNRLAVAA